MNDVKTHQANKASRERASSLTRRKILTFAGAGAASGISGLRSWAQGVSTPPLEKELVLSTRGGYNEQGFRRQINPLFEKLYGVKVSVVVDTSSGGYAKLRAQQSNPQVDVFFSLSVTQAQGKIDGMWAKNDLSVTTNLKNVDPRFHDQDNMGVPINASVNALEYNAAVYSRLGIPAPTSWNDIFHPAVAGRVAMGPVADYDGQALIVAISRANGSDERNPDVAFKKLAALGDKLLIVKQANIDDYFKQEAVWIALNITQRVYLLADAGFPVKVAWPKEGAMSTGANYMTPVANCPHPRAAQAYLNFMLSPEVQQIFASLNYVPMLTNLDLPPAIAERMPTAEQISKFIVQDDRYINSVLDTWINRANRELGRKS